jgi:predicted transcriptional regulator
VEVEGMAKQNVTIRLDDELWRRVRAVCGLSEITPSELIGDYLSQWLKQHEREAAQKLTGATAEKGAGSKS